MFMIENLPGLWGAHWVFAADIGSSLEIGWEERDSCQVYTQNFLILMSGVNFNFLI